MILAPLGGADLLKEGSCCWTSLGIFVHQLLLLIDFHLPVTIQPFSPFLPAAHVFLTRINCIPMKIECLLPLECFCQHVGDVKTNQSFPFLAYQIISGNSLSIKPSSEKRIIPTSVIILSDRLH